MLSKFARLVCLTVVLVGVALIMSGYVRLGALAMMVSIGIVFYLASADNVL